MWYNICRVYGIGMFACGVLVVLEYNVAHTRVCTCYSFAPWFGRQHVPSDHLEPRTSSRFSCRFELSRSLFRRITPRLICYLQEFILYRRFILSGSEFGYSDQSVHGDARLSLEVKVRYVVTDKHDF